MLIKKTGGGQQDLGQSPAEGRGQEQHVMATVITPAMRKRIGRRSQQFKAIAEKLNRSRNGVNVTAAIVLDSTSTRRTADRSKASEGSCGRLLCRSLSGASPAN